MSEKEASMNYKTIQRLGFVKEMYRACYDGLCMVEKVRIPIVDYVGEEGEKRYRELLNEVLLKLEELSDMLWMMGEEVWEGDE